MEASCWSQQKIWKKPSTRVLVNLRVTHYPWTQLVEQVNYVSICQE